MHTHKCQVNFDESHAIRDTEIIQVVPGQAGGGSFKINNYPGKRPQTVCFEEAKKNGNRRKKSVHTAGDMLRNRMSVAHQNCHNSYHPKQSQLHLVHFLVRKRFNGSQ